MGNDPNSNLITSYRILGTPISLISIPRLLCLFDQWTGDGHDHSVVFRDVHGVIRARTDEALNKAHEQSDLVLPDGVPIVWSARLAGVKDVSRVCGPDLFYEACDYGVSRGWRHYFYGGLPGVAEKLKSELTKTFPGIEIVGTDCPPFRSLTKKEDEIAGLAIRTARPNFVWIGLGTPKQEIWMAEHRGKCGGAILLGIGAAFDIHALLIPRAPKWMQKSGLEWSFRLWQEPRRLSKRYLKSVPIFLALALIELLRRLMPAKTIA